MPWSAESQSKYNWEEPLFPGPSRFLVGLRIKLT